MAKKDLAGQKFGRLLVLNREGVDKHRHTLWKCKCDCGNEVIVARTELVSGDTKSCGCYHREQITKYNKKNKVKHGLHDSRIAIVWKNMISRCEKENDSGYKHYGGRGITVCEEWHDLKAFAEWAYKNGYDENAPRGECTLERINVNGNYEPANCKWADIKEQNRNRTITVRVTREDGEIPLSKLCEEKRISYKKIYRWMHEKGKTFDDAIEMLTNSL